MNEAIGSSTRGPLFTSCAEANRKPKTTATSVRTESNMEGAIDVNNTITKKFADLRPISMERVKGFFPLGKLVTHKSFKLISVPKPLSLTSPAI